ncbi:TIGR02444 family protein [Mesorhizobium sp. BAC0120]|uniref:TIGR02444 family protein n=1 Tax=Mesorhizobium sp. BAC0120 TaxID=3090670 RepID=UPI00298BF294|nr:TIGR02444 family protein [Mesorhizobium sp. BAC0120]MDW6024340.1 TIGR02444 family protein [Mesorhizobium sp. BAC0120]
MKETVQLTSQRVNNEKAPADLWAFMLSVYSRPGVAPACLRLQDDHGLDIPLMLAVLYGGVTGRVPSSEQIRTFDQNCRVWRETAVRPLRQVRRAMKSHNWLASQPRILLLRERVKAAELDAEKVEAEVLEQMLGEILPSSRLCDVEGLLDLTVSVLDLYDPERKEWLPSDLNAIAAAVLLTVK